MSYLMSVDLRSFCEETTLNSILKLKIWNKGNKYMDISEDLIANVMKHLDKETSGGSMRMSVNFDESQKEESIVSHKCCHAYGNPATDTIAKLDMYSDLYLKDMDESE